MCIEIHVNRTPGLSVSHAERRYNRCSGLSSKLTVDGSSMRGPDSAVDVEKIGTCCIEEEL